MSRQYTITEDTYTDLEKMIGKLTAAAAKRGIVAPVALKVVETIDLALGDGTAERYLRVEMSGDSTQISVWRFTAVIQHEKDGNGGWRNIVRHFPGLDGIELPARFRTAGPDCEQCGVKVFRKDSYIARHLGTGDWRQFGSSCLGAATGVGNALGILETIQKAEDKLAAAAKADPGVPKTDPQTRRNGAYVGTLGFLAQVARQMRDDDGKFWGKAAAADACRQPTAWGALDGLREVAWLASRGIQVNAAFIPTEADQAVAQTWLDWARSFTPAAGDSFQEALIAALANATVSTRSAFFAAAVAPTYHRAHPDAAPALTLPVEVDAGWAGTLGQPITVTVKIERAVASTGQWASTGYFMRDAAGHRFVWWSSSSADLQEGATITLFGKVKRHNTYAPRYGQSLEPVKQTVLSFCRVLEEA